ncbi:MAG: class I SAM-dependent methyltransferase [Pseudomonadota bacterium]
MLSVIVDPKLLFSNYPYRSSTSRPYIQHCLEMYEDIQRYTRIDDDVTVVDIGGNDGTLLAAFKERNPNLDCINVDPCADFAKDCSDKGIRMIPGLWNGETARHFVDKKARVITSTNVFQHAEDILDFARSIHRSLDDVGVWCLEFPYWKKDLQTNQYDQVYHEHIYYYTVTPLLNLFEQIGFQIVDISKQEIHGGSLRLMMKKSGTSACKSIPSYLNEEAEFTPERYKKWGGQAQTHIRKSREYLKDLKQRESVKVAAFGAAAKGCVFLNVTGLDDSTIDYIIDDTPAKQGKYMGGTGIRIVDRSILKTDPPEYLLILAHNFSDFICQSLLPVYQGKFIKMFPEPHVFS